MSLLPVGRIAKLPINLVKANMRDRAPCISRRNFEPWDLRFALMSTLQNLSLQLWKNAKQEKVTVLSFTKRLIGISSGHHLGI